MRSILLALFIWGSFTIISAGPLEIAEQYLNFEWTVHYSNVWDNYAASGNPLDGYTNVYPCDWVNKIGTTIAGMPYHYGGKDSFEQWDSDYENGNRGPGAHSVHLNGARNSLSWAAGIDCSGFVGRCWEVAEIGNCNCTYLTQQSTQIPSIQVQPGDAFIRTAYDNHARLCYARIEDALQYQWVDVIEAASGDYDKVVKLQYTIEEQMGASFMCYSYSDCTNIAGGSVSGTWTFNDGPYMINGDIVVDTTSTLTIEAGVNVIFTGHYSFTVNGRLLAQGTEDMNVFFTAQDTTTGWGGLRFIDTTLNGQGQSQLVNCRIERGRATGIWPANCGGGIFCQYSNVLVDTCVIVKNYAAGGGGIYLYNHSNASINYSLIARNTATEGGGGVMMYQSCYPVLANDTIVDNIVENTMYGGGGGIFGSTNCNPTVGNSIIWGNTSAEVWFTGNSTPTFLYCDTGDYVYPGTGNISSNPLFTNTNPEYYELTESSPCVDAGYPGATDPDGTRLDMGAFPYYHAPEPPGVRLYIQDNQVNIECSGAQRNTYAVYSSDSPDGTFSIDTSGSFTGNVWTAPLTENARFYYVITVSGNRSHDREEKQ